MINVLKRKPNLKETMIGAVLVFKPGTTDEQAKTALDLLRALLWDEAGYPEVRRFDPEMGGPVWYIP